jgi:hypothetical protein
MTQLPNLSRLAVDYPILVTIYPQMLRPYGWSGTLVVPTWRGCQSVLSCLGGRDPELVEGCEERPWPHKRARPPRSLAKATAKGMRNISPNKNAACNTVRL